MAYKRKTIDRWDIMTNYGYGWECENSEYTWKDAKRSVREYRENVKADVRLEKHREKVSDADYQILKKCGRFSIVKIGSGKGN